MIQNQQQVWNSIAKDWNKFKTTTDPKVEKFMKKSKGNLLDLGCGSGRNFNSNTKATIYGIDFSQEMIKYAAKRAKKLGIKSNLLIHDIITKLPYKNNFFSNVICIATLHCIEGKNNRIRILKELKRVLKPNVKLLIKVWNKNNRKFKNKGKEKLIRWTNKGSRYYYFYEAEELENELKNTGFKIINSKSKDKNFELQEIIIVCKK